MVYRTSKNVKYFNYIKKPSLKSEHLNTKNISSSGKTAKQYLFTIIFTAN